MKCFNQFPLNKIKTLPFTFIGFAFFVVLMNAFSTSASSSINYANNLKDTGNTDTIGQLSTIDSSKIFVSLLSPDNKNNFSIAINPEAKLFVDNYIKKHTNAFNNMKIWGKPYFDLYDRIFTAYGIPVQLKYLSVIESSLNCTALSYAGAVGPWQIMADAAREHGLRTGYYDDRLDYTKSTKAAAQILKELYANYKDWLLVIAAYNCGIANVNRAIAKAHSNNFWKIQYYLPEETRNHVKKFIATHYYFEGDGSIATLTGNDAQNAAFANTDAYTALAANATTLSIYGKYNSIVIANNLAMDISTFNQLNPGLDDLLAKGQVYPMRLPYDKAQLFQSKKLDILKQSVELLLSSASTSGR